MDIKILILIGFILVVIEILFLYGPMGIIGNILTFFLGSITAIFAEPIRRRIFSSVLNLEFDKSEDCLSKTPEAITGIGQRIDAIYVRVRVNNKKNIIAKDCKAYLINIEKKDGKDNFLSTVYCDSIQLAWACRNTSAEAYGGIDIPKGINQYIACCSY